MTTDNPASPQREIAPGVDIPRYTFGDPNVACQFVRYSDYAALASSADVWRERCEALEADKQHYMDEAAKWLDTAAKNWQAYTAAEVNARRYLWLRDPDNAAEIGVVGAISYNLDERIDAALGQRAAMGGEK